MKLWRVRRDLYRSARLLGDVGAVRRDPKRPLGVAKDASWGGPSAGSFKRFKRLLHPNQMRLHSSTISRPPIGNVDGDRGVHVDRRHRRQIVGASAVTVTSQFEAGGIARPPLSY